MNIDDFNGNMPVDLEDVPSMTERSLDTMLSKGIKCNVGGCRNEAEYFYEYFCPTNLEVNTLCICKEHAEWELNR